jgi:excisionase family DNA binding protein
MAEGKLLSVMEVAEEFSVTDQTIRNWIKAGTLKAVRIGRDHRIRREDVDELIARAQARTTPLATRRDIWAPETMGLPHRKSEAENKPSIWDGDGAPLTPAKRS